jgi:hypothetical protein
MAAGAVTLASTLAVANQECAAQEVGSEVATREAAVTAAREAIQSEVRAFYRDLAARDWPTLLSHFWPAKITARWEPPVESGSWIADREDAPPNAVGSGSASGRRADACAGDGARAPWADVRIEGRWARVLVAHCAAKTDELWLLDVNGRWKIVRLILGG